MLDENYKKQLEMWDKAYLWHPFTQMQDYIKETPLIIKEGNGIYLKDINGKEYIDGVSSMWCNIHGHRNKEIDDAIKKQLDKVAHTTLLGPSNIPAIELARKIAEITPQGLNKIFYSDNGSTANEVALKMAFQYWQHKGVKNKTQFVALQYGYHGDTIGTMSISGIELFCNAFRPLYFKTHLAPAPYCYRCPFGKDKNSCMLRCLEALETILKENAEHVAAMIMEPLIEGAGGMITHPEGYLASVRSLCKKYNIILILDEVLTGFGRTGKMFACLHENIIPDIITLSKGINGGYMPLAATIATEEIYNAFLGEYSSLKTLFHGHTYTGNPLGCAAALASIQLFEKNLIIKNLKPKISHLHERLKTFESLEHVGDIRQCGLIAAIELVKDKTTKEAYPLEKRIGIKVCFEARKHGLLIRPLGHIIIIMPPLIISKEEMDRMLDIIYNSIKSVTSK
ncbi:MAG TPA: adenosylmethionine--8-amino-7-oxononanoate transaminase [Candidatus Wujingus californicus]|uniref:adenosylmethionine--8-amino-7-oxononanoate transaminase n=1 Tax=Candidatus Wujingus californicus TaxID=3367618 RepID=UPI001D8E23C7|nr:adenosylmethionine--8-amino-7-oxononanoate transaminase [Planctomycetota bacterium]MDO8132133.1 adenosylmethionine--8-amino-7-oxononanoate transaminase [Candidatus Brocadiales bacterium]